MATSANEPLVAPHVLPAARRRRVALPELLTLDVLNRATVVAGRAGLNRVVQRVGVLESVGEPGRIRSSELLLTSGLPLRDASAPELRRLVSALVAAGGAGPAPPVGPPPPP